MNFDILTLIKSDDSEWNLKIENLKDKVRENIFFLQEGANFNFLTSLELLKEKYWKKDLIKLYNKKSITEVDFIEIVIKIAKIEKLDSEFIWNFKISNLINWSNLLFKLNYILKNKEKIWLLKYLSFEWYYDDITKKINILIDEKNKDSFILNNIWFFYKKLQNLSKKTKIALHSLVIKFLPLNEDFIEYFWLDFFSGISDERIERISKLSLEDIKNEIEKIKKEVKKENWEVKNNWYISVIAKKRIKDDKTRSKTELKKLAIDFLLNRQESSFRKKYNSGEQIKKKGYKKFKPIKINTNIPLSNSLKQKFDKIYSEFNIKWRLSSTVKWRDDFNNEYILVWDLWYWRAFSSFIFYLVDKINNAKSESEIEKIPQILLNLKYWNVSNWGKKKEYILMVNKHYKKRKETF